MSISAINSLSLYEYYYSIGKTSKKESPLADELDKYGLESTGNAQLDAVLLENVRGTEKNDDEKNDEESYSSRPWSDIMYQLNIPFNNNPLDDIDDIKEELDKLISGINDEEINDEIRDLKDYVDELYIDYEKHGIKHIDTSTTLTSQLNNMAMVNIAFR